MVYTTRTVRVSSWYALSGGWGVAKVVSCRILLGLGQSASTGIVIKREEGMQKSKPGAKPAGKPAPKKK